MSAPPPSFVFPFYIVYDCMSPRLVTKARPRRKAYSYMLAMVLWLFYFVALVVGSAYTFQENMGDC